MQFILPKRDKFFHKKWLRILIAIGSCHGVAVVIRCDERKCSMSLVDRSLATAFFMPEFRRKQWLRS